MKTRRQSTKPSPIASPLRNLFGLAAVGGMTVQMTPGLAQDARLFRIVGPVATTISSATADGIVTWTNQAPNAVVTVQTAAALPS